MTKPEKSASMGAAECARRTGLTVRALRVYERHGLIEPRRTAVERALALVRAALATIGSGKPLSLEDLCNLTRSMEMSTEMDTGQLFATVRGLINENLTPEEERAHRNWAASRPSEELAAALVPSIPGQVIALTAAQLAGFRPSYRMLSFVLTMQGYAVNHELPGEDRANSVAGLEREINAWAGLEPER